MEDQVTTDARAIVQHMFETETHEISKKDGITRSEIVDCIEIAEEIIETLQEQLEEIDKDIFDKNTE